jgi:hypothetical protein
VSGIRLFKLLHLLSSEYLLNSWNTTSIFKLLYNRQSIMELGYTPLHPPPQRLTPSKENKYSTMRCKYCTVRFQILYSEVSGTVQWGFRYCTVRFQILYSEVSDIVQWDFRYCTVRFQILCSEVSDTVQWGFRYCTMRFQVLYNEVSQQSSLGFNLPGCDALSLLKLFPTVFEPLSPERLRLQFPSQEPLPLWAVSHSRMPECQMKYYLHCYIHIVGTQLVSVEAL